MFSAAEIDEIVRDWREIDLKELLLGIDMPVGHAWLVLEAAGPPFAIHLYETPAEFLPVVESWNEFRKSADIAELHSLFNLDLDKGDKPEPPPPKRGRKPRE